MGDLSNLEFCSKWFFIAGGSLVAVRDYVKTVSTKQYYTRTNRHILSQPHIHRFAILSGVKSEQASHLLEDLLQVSAPARVTGWECEQVEEYLKKQYSPAPANYAAEHYINAKLGLSSYDILCVIKSNRFICGRDPLNELEGPIYFDLDDNSM